MQPEDENDASYTTVDENNATHKTPRPRHLKCPQLWKCSIRKQARNSGEAHFNTSNKYVKKKKPRDVTCNCRLECSSFSESDRQNICTEYWSSGSYSSQYVFVALMKALYDSSTLRTVTMNFLHAGHTQMEVDSMHSAIETAKKEVDVSIPNDWKKVLLLARCKDPYTVPSLTYDHFLNFKKTSLKDRLSTDTEGKAVKWGQLVSLRISKEDPDHVWVKADYDDAYRAICVTPRVLRGRGETSTLQLPDITEMAL